jgi:hypothetical protein
MPNYCANYITISGDEKSIGFLTRIIEGIPQEERNNSNVFETLIGREPEINDEQYVSGGWYNSNIGWFGTKWDVSYNDCQFQFSESSIIMMPQTAWSPPIGFGVRLHEKYGVNVELQYEESGCDFCGRTIIENQEIIEEDYGFLEGKYKLDNEGFWYEVESDIEYAINDETSVDEFMERFHFVDEEDRNEIQKMYEDSLVENKSE